MAEREPFDPGRDQAQTSRRPRAALWLLGLWLLLLAAGGWVAARAQYRADLSAFLPAAPSAEQRVLLDQLRSGVTTRLLLIGIRGGQPEQRQQASRELAQALRTGGPQAGHFDALHNGEGDSWKETGEFLFAHRYLLSPAVDAQRFTVEGLREAFDETASVLGTPAGSLMKPLLWRDPTGETLRMAESMMSANSPRSEGGVWVSRSEPRALLLGTTHADGADLDGQAAAQAAVRAAFAPWAARGLTLELSGPGTFAVQSRASIQHEVERLAWAGTAIMLGLLWLAFGTLRPLGVAMLPVASGVLAGIVAVALGFGTVHGMTLGFGTTLIGEAVDYAIYFLIQSNPPPGVARAGEPGEPGATGQGYRAWLREQWPTVRLGLWTSVAGFAALVGSGFPGLAQLGVFSIAGLLAAAATTRWVLPVLAPDGAPGQGWLGARRRLGRIALRAAQRLPATRALWIGLVALALVWLVWQPTPWRANLSSLSPVTPAALALDASLRADLGASESGSLVAVSGADEQTVLERAEAVGLRLDALVARGLLRGYDSPARLLPSVRRQQARLAALPEAEVLRQRVAQAAQDGPLRADKLVPFVEAVDAQRHLTPLTGASLAGTPLAPLLQAQLVAGAAATTKEPGRPWTALLSLQFPGDDAQAQAAALQALRAALADLPEVRVVQIQSELSALYAHYLREAQWQAGLGALAVVLLLFWHLRAERQALRRLVALLLPLAAAVLLVMGALAAAGVALGVLHLVGFLLVVAVGSNYALFFDHLAQAGSGPVDDSETLASLLLANLTTVASFGLLATSGVAVLAAIGQVVAPGAALALILSAAFQSRRGVARS
ncbi:MAG: transporter [Burkholderiales bacterium]|nr:transporter [Burkholderiales bacterium]